MRKIIAIMTALILCIGAAAVYADTSTVQSNDTAEDITVTAEGKILENGVDYILSYQDNVNPGTATVTVNFIGNYEGTMEKTFEIVRKKRTSSGGGSGGGWVNTVGDKNTAIGDAVFDQNKEYNAPYITGYEDNTFRPNAEITRAETAVMVLRAESGADNIAEEPQAAPAFSDISEHWAKGYISAAADKGIVNGYGDDTFRPDNHITRAEFAKIIAKMLGSASQNTKAEFTDVVGHWAEPYIALLTEKGIITGYPDGSFKPDAPITRAEAVAIINRTAPRSGNPATVKQFEDVIPNHWAYEEIMKAAERTDGE